MYSCESPKEPEELPAQEIAIVIDQVTDIMVHDVTNPPLAARFYAYITLAGIEALKGGNDSLQKLVSQINGYEDAIGTIATSLDVDKELSAIFAMLNTAKHLQPSGFEHEKNIQAFKKKCLSYGYAEKTVHESMFFGEVVSARIIGYAKSDKYNQTSSLPRYTPKKVEGNWYPTPPGYFTPVEPYFNTLRPFLIDSANQFIPNPPKSFSLKKDSEFYQLMEEVYSQEITEEKRLIASFWDCNPFALEDKGHLMIGLKKISPGAHWMGIANIACKDAGVDFKKAMEINGVLAMTLHDSFIACWDEKYRSDRIRPETAIRKYIDPKYQPLLQTPPFPEYLSGHSVASTASSIVLTHYFGEDFSYIDTVEVKYGLEARHFSSFSKAAEEAAISRLYGGIHYMDGITEGQDQGRKIGNWTVGKLTQQEIKIELAENNINKTQPKQ